MVDRVEKYQLDKTRAMLARERHHRIEAANRELETLLLLERASNEKGVTEQENGITNISESYMTKLASKRLQDDVTKEETRMLVPKIECENDPSSNNVEENNDTLEPESTESNKQSIQDSTTNSPSAEDPPSLNHSIRPTSSSTNLAPHVSILHYADADLSTELRRVLNRSTLEFGAMSTMRSTIGREFDQTAALPRSSVVGNSIYRGLHLSKISDEGDYLDKTEELERNHVSLE